MDGSDIVDNFRGFCTSYISKIIHLKILKRILILLYALYINNKYCRF